MTKIRIVQDKECGGLWKEREIERREMAVQLNYQLGMSTLKQGIQLNPFLPTQRFAALQAGAVSGKFQQLTESGSVRPISPKEAVFTMRTEGYVLLDIRPEWEREKARVSGSLHVPLFVKDIDNSPITLLKKWVHFGYIGLWTGQYFTMINPDFLQQVESLVPDKNAKLLVACGEGLRSTMAASKLHEGGYRNLGWLAGGFNRAADDDFPDIEGKEKLQYATIGGEGNSTKHSDPEENSTSPNVWVII